MRTSRVQIGLVVLCLLTASLTAQANICDPTKTILDCYNQYLGAAGWKAESAEAESDELAVKETGSAATGKPTASAISDFIPLFTASADGGDLGGDDASLTLALNRFLGIPVNDGYRLEATLNRATLYQPLREAFETAQLPVRIDELEKQIDDFSDVNFLFGWSPMNEKLGRSFDVHANEYSRLLDLVASNVKRPSSVRVDTAEMQRYYTKIVDDTQERARKRLADPNYLISEMEKVLVLDVRDQAELESRIQRAATGLADYRAALESTAEAVSFFGFSDLINNQPQVVVEATWNARDDLVGPDAGGVKVSYEVGWANVNAYKRECRSQATDQVLPCFTAYYAKHKREIERGDRLAISAEYSRTQAYAIAFPTDAIAFDLPSEHTLKGSLTYGRYFGELRAADESKTRLDVAAEYEDHGDDPNMPTRAVLSATLSRKIADGVALQFGLTWANKPEFVGDSARDTSAHVGLSYKLIRDKKESAK